MWPRQPAGGVGIVQAHRAKVGERMSSQATTVELFVAAYGDEKGAADALKDFQSAHRAGAIDLIDAAVIVHTADDKVHFEETADPSGKKWAKRGAIAGGIAGLIFPPSIIAIAEDRVVEQLARGLEGYDKIARHLVSADAAAAIAAEVETS